MNRRLLCRYCGLGLRNDQKIRSAPRKPRAQNRAPAKTVLNGKPGPTHLYLFPSGGGFFITGGKHVQFNVVDRDTLIEATRKPEKHRDLIVRVAGYSAYFVKLTPAIQTEIIARSELRTA